VTEESTTEPFNHLWRGHLRTLRARVARAIRPTEPAPSEPWETVIDDPVVGAVRLTGRLQVPPGSRAIAVLVHGLGGCAESDYLVRMARAIHDQAGVRPRADGEPLACLRLNLRGSDRQGEDYYHAGLTADLRGALASPALAGFETVYLVGYSMGGHVALRYGTEAESVDLPGEPSTSDGGIDPRVAAIAAICAPLDLARTGRVMDQPGFWIYRRYLLSNLMEIYRAVAARRPVPTPVEEAARIRLFRAWDDRIVAPRHGFADAADYYARASVGPRLERLCVPSLLVAAEDDPMVPASTVRPVLGELGALARSALQVRFMPTGGHMAFPGEIDLGLEQAHGAPNDLESQLLAWLRDPRWRGGAGA